MFKRRGDWNKAMKVCFGLERYGKQARIHVLQKLAEKAQRTVVGHIIAQDLAWRELSDRRIREKGHDRILQDSGLLMNSIGFFHNENDAKVGVKSSATYPDGTPVEKVAKDNEYGNGTNIPERQLWRPSVHEVRIWQQSSINNPSKILFYLLKSA